MGESNDLGYMGHEYKLQGGIPEAQISPAGVYSLAFVSHRNITERISFRHSACSSPSLVQNSRWHFH